MYQDAGDYIIRQVDRTSKLEQLLYLSKLLIKYSSNTSNSGTASFKKTSQIHLFWTLNKDKAITFTKNKANDVIGTMYPSQNRTYTTIHVA